MMDYFSIIGKFQTFCLLEWQLLKNLTFQWRGIIWWKTFIKENIKFIPTKLLESFILLLRCNKINYMPNHEVRLDIFCHTYTYSWNIYKYLFWMLFLNMGKKSFVRFGFISFLKNHSRKNGRNNFCKAPESIQ